MVLLRRQSSSRCIKKSGRHFVLSLLIAFYLIDDGLESNELYFILGRRTSILTILWLISILDHEKLDESLYTWDMLEPNWLRLYRSLHSSNTTNRFHHFFKSSSFKPALTGYVRKWSRSSSNFKMVPEKRNRGNLWIGSVFKFLHLSFGFSEATSVSNFRRIAGYIFSKFEIVSFL